MFRGLSSVGRRITEVRWHHRAVGGSNTLDDHLLRDIGIHRTTLQMPRVRIDTGQRRR